MKNVKGVLFGLLFGLLFGYVSVSAQTAQPGLIYYKGSLVDYQGKLVQDTLSIKFSIFNVSSGGSAMWSETHPAVIIWGGVYTVLLGNLTPLPEAIFWDQVPASVVRLGGDRWLGVNVAGQSELITRKRIATVAYAYHADVLDGRHASEFVSSVHPDTMEGVDWCSGTIPMLTVINSCDGGAILAECSTGTGVTGQGRVGVYGSTSVAGGLPVHGWARDAATQAGYFDGNVTVNGDAQVGLDMADFHILGIPARDAWGYVYSPGAGVPSQPSGMDMAYNFHEDSTGTGIIDNSSPGMGTSRIRLSDGRVELGTNKLAAEPLTRVLIDTNGVIFYGPIATPRFKVDTLYVPDTCYVSGNLSVNGSVGVGTPAPSQVKFDVKGSGTYSGNHMAVFENTGSFQGDGIAVKLSNGTPSHENRFVSFLGSDGTSHGRIEGQLNKNELENLDVSYKSWKINWDLEIARVSIDGVAAALSIFQCGNCICIPPPSWIAKAIAWGVTLAVYKDKYYDYREAHIGVSYYSGSGDYAEWLERIDADEPIEPGDIVGVFGGKISRETAGAQQILVVSTTPIVLGNMPREDEEQLYEKVAFLGQVPVKIIGPVEEGDFIIPSGFEDGTGVAISPEMMTVDEYTKVVGRSWDRSESPFMKTVTVAVGLNSGDVADILKKQTEKNRVQKERLNGLKDQLNELSGLGQKIEKLEAALNQIPASVPGERVDTSERSSEHE
jgi:hypothetical protein